MGLNDRLDPGTLKNQIQSDIIKELRMLKFQFRIFKYISS